MNEIKQLLDAGDLDGAIAAATAVVKARPTDAGARTLLFEVLALAGEWDRALKQLDVIAHGDTQREIGIQVYRNNIAALRSREKLFDQGGEPHFLIEPPAYIDHLLASINHARAGDATATRMALDQAEVARPAFAGRLDDTSFDDMRDADDFVASVLEAVVSDKYAWIPFEQIKVLEVRAPQHLRDLVWTPARIELRAGTIGEIFIPALYRGSHLNADPRVRLGHVTEWESVIEAEGTSVERGVGLRLFFIDDADKAVTDLRRIEFHTDDATIDDDAIDDESMTGDAIH